MKLPSLKALALILGLSSSALPDARGELPGTYQTTWVGNTFEGAGPNAKGRWVQNMIASAAVTPDGTVIAASVWRGDAPEGQIQRHRFRHWSDEGKPVFGLEKADSFSRPEHFTEIARVLYVPETDTMYLSGYTKDKPAPSWGLMGAILERYDDWTSGAPKRRWSIDLPVDDDKLPPKSFDVAGDYVFTVQVKPTRGVPAMVNVYRASDGGHAGFMRPGPEVGGNSGWVDMTHGLQAMQRKDGTYLLIVQENARAKNIVYRWQPPTSTAHLNRTLPPMNSCFLLSPCCRRSNGADAPCDRAHADDRRLVDTLLLGSTSPSQGGRAVGDC